MGNVIKKVLIYLSHRQAQKVKQTKSHAKSAIKIVFNYKKGEFLFCIFSLSKY